MLIIPIKLLMVNNAHINNNINTIIIILMIIVPLLVGGIPTPLKNMSSSVGMIFHSQDMESHNPVMFQSPPTRYRFYPH